MAITIDVRLTLTDEEREEIRRIAETYLRTTSDVCTMLIQERLFDRPRGLRAFGTKKYDERRMDG